MELGISYKESGPYYKLLLMLIPPQGFYGERPIPNP
jgi:hypothetical protein